MGFDPFCLFDSKINHPSFAKRFNCLFTELCKNGQKTKYKRLINHFTGQVTLYSKTNTFVIKIFKILDKFFNKFIKNMRIYEEKGGR